MVQKNKTYDYENYDNLVEAYINENEYFSGTFQELFDFLNDQGVIESLDFRIVSNRVSYKDGIRRNSIQIKGNDIEIYIHTKPDRIVPDFESLNDLVSYMNFTEDLLDRYNDAFEQAIVIQDFDYKNAFEYYSKNHLGSYYSYYDAFVNLYHHAVGSKVMRFLSNLITESYLHTFLQELMEDKFVCREYKNRIHVFGDEMIPYVKKPTRSEILPF